VIRFDGKKFSTLSTKQGLPNNFIRSFFEDSHGAMWIGTRDGLARYYQGKIRVYSNRDGLAHTFIRSIIEDKNGNLWVGTVNGGVHRFVNGKFVNYRSLGIPMNAVRSLLVDHNNTVWVSGNEAVILWHDGKINTLTTYDGLPTDPIYCLYEDSAHVVWMGTNGGGLVRYKDSVITRYTYAEGLGDDVVYEILEDDQHNFWMSCNGGIYRVSKQQLNDYADGRIQRIRCTFYDASDGMISNEVDGNSQPAGLKTPDGRLWFPALKGVVIADPKKIPDKISPPPIMIERVILNSIETHMPQNGLVVPPGSGRAEFHFAALTYTSPQQVRYRIKLEGSDNEWIEMGDKMDATYNNLSPGKYVFHVAAYNNDDTWNQTESSLAFELGQYFYQTAWFYGLVVIAFLTMSFGLYHWRVWRILKREQELQKRVDEAMSEIKILGGLIPICANCKKIRDDQGFWKQLETISKNIQKHPLRTAFARNALKNFTEIS
jgi:streptogramin lyase